MAALPQPRAEVAEMNWSCRIVLIHALKESQAPAWSAFARGWPEARIFNLLDDSLSADFAEAGALTPTMVERFLTLGRYAAGANTDSQPTRAILFTCSAFGAAIDRVKRDLSIPVLRPNEAAFEAALNTGRRIGLMSTFPKSLPPLVDELHAMAADRGVAVEVTTIVAEGGLKALQSGNGGLHDSIAAEAAARHRDLDALVLCQFSLARAASGIAPVPGRAVFTTPDSAVAKLKTLLQACG
jgi:hypothetical protein